MAMIDNEKVFDEKILPLALAIREICDEHEMPFALDVVYARDEETRAQDSYINCLSLGNKHINRVYAAMVKNSVKLGTKGGQHGSSDD